MLSLGIILPELEPMPFANGLGAARAALRHLCAQRSHARVLSQSAALPRAGADYSSGNYGDMLSAILSPEFTTVLGPLDPARSPKLKLDNPLVLPVHTARARIATAKAIASINLGNSPDCCRLKHD